ncbi:MAG: phasin family protein [Nitrospirae bacterium]|nr:phasin family protein [Nitrospirota bacterium]
MALSEIFQKTLLAGLGIQEKLGELIDELVKKGELSEAQGKKLFKEWSDKAGKAKGDFDKNLNELIEKSIKKLNVPTKKEMDELGKKLQSLSKKVDKLEKALAKD